MNNVYLIGSETVERAASSMRVSADEVSRAASSFSSTAEMLTRSLDDHATRIEQAMEELARLMAGAPSMLDRYALAAIPALIGRDGTAFPDDIADAYHFADLALKSPANAPTEVTHGG